MQSFHVISPIQYVETTFYFNFGGSYKFVLFRRDLLVILDSYVEIYPLSFFQSHRIFNDFVGPMRLVIIFVRMYIFTGTFVSEEILYLIQER